MTPAARLAAAIELVDLTAKAGAADREVRAYFRARRYAGAKDRNAVTELVFAIERRQAELRFRLGGAASSARLQVMAARLLFDGATPAEIDGLCTGIGHAPAALTGEEREVLARIAAERYAPLPDWARDGYPQWLEERLKRRFGSEVMAEMAAMQARAPADLRVNRLKSSREDVLQRLADEAIPAQPTPLSPIGVRLAAHPPLERSALYLDGLIEPQDEGSQLAALLVGARPGMLVVDLCAGAGGKTLAIAAEMANAGALIACDADARRLQRLAPRLQRAGARNVTLRPLQGGSAAMLADLAGRCDRVLLDVPCSGSGTWRRQPWARWSLTEAALVRDLRLQAELLRTGAGLVGPGGRLVYVTCSLLAEENDDQIAA